MKIQTGASGCTICRLAAGSLSNTKQELIDELIQLATDSYVEYDSEVLKSFLEDGEREAVEQILKNWLEDKDDLLYFDGAIYDPSIEIKIDNQCFEINELLSLGSRLKLVDNIAISLPANKLLTYHKTTGSGNLEWLPICGEQDSLIKLCGSLGRDVIKAIAPDIEILTKKFSIHEPDSSLYEDLEMFVGIAYKSKDLYEWHEDWGDGSYSFDNFLYFEDAEIHRSNSNLDGSFQPISKEEVLSLIKTVCRSFD